MDKLVSSYIDDLDSNEDLQEGKMMQTLKVTKTGSIPKIDKASSRYTE